MISIVLPIYNGERYLQQALESVAKQSYSDFECICIDDGSEDASADIVRNMAGKDSRFRLVKQMNGGVATARNNGLDRAKGVYVTFLDQDDALAPVALERMLDVAKETRCGVVAAGIREFTDANLPCFGQNGKSQVNISVSPCSDFWDWDKVCRVAVSVWGKLYSVESLRAVRFPDGVFGADDYVFTARLFSKLDRYASIDERLYLYRMHADNVTTQMPMKYIMGMLKSREMVWKELLAESNMARNLLKKVSRRFCKEMLSWAVKKTCRQCYTEKEMCLLRKEVGRLIDDGVLVPCGLRDKLKAHLFCLEQDWALRFLFPSLFKNRKWKSP